MQLIEDINDVELLEELKSQIQEHQNPFKWDDLPNNVQQNILEAREELKQGGGRPHLEVSERYKKWR